MDNAEVDGVDFRHFGPTATGVFKFNPQYDSIFWCFEVAMDQMDTKSLVSPMADEERCELCICSSEMGGCSVSSSSLL